MRLTVAAVGRAKKGPELALFEQYAKRIKGGLSLIEVEEKRPLPSDQRKIKEASLLLNAISDQAVVIALDERGKNLSSPELADRLGRWRDDGVRDLVFAIGGADGHGAALLERAQLTFSFGRATWPHMLVRAMVAEQAYRALTILEGHPYHRQ